MSTILTGRGAPTILTVGFVGQRYIDIDYGAEYRCKDINNTVDIETKKHSFVTVTSTEDHHIEYIWEETVKGGAGGEYDAVFCLSENDHSFSYIYEHSDVMSIKSGNAQDLIAKMTSNIPVRVRVYKTTGCGTLEYYPNRVWYDDEGMCVNVEFDAFSHRYRIIFSDSFLTFADDGPNS